MRNLITPEMMKQLRADYSIKCEIISKNDFLVCFQQNLYDMFGFDLSKENLELFIRVMFFTVCQILRKRRVKGIQITGVCLMKTSVARSKPVLNFNFSLSRKFLGFLNNKDIPHMDLLKPTNRDTSKDEVDEDVDDDSIDSMYDDDLCNEEEKKEEIKTKSKKMKKVIVDNSEELEQVLNELE